jgi:hypothetical protein
LGESGRPLGEYRWKKEVSMVVRLLPVLLALAAVLAPGASADRPPASWSCTVAAAGPFFYAGDVIPDTSVSCATPQRRLQIEAVLTRDGVPVASASRSCRNAGTCIISVDALAPDIPGNQTWCVSASGSVGSTSVGRAESCESEDF